MINSYKLRWVETEKENPNSILLTRGSGEQGYYYLELEESGEFEDGYGGDIELTPAEFKS